MSKFLDALEKLAGTAGGILGGPLVPVALEIGKDVLALIHTSKQVVEETDIPKLEAMEADLGPKVMAHADRTAATLRGE